MVSFCEEGRNPKKAKNEQPKVDEQSKDGDEPPALESEKVPIQRQAPDVQWEGRADAMKYNLSWSVFEKKE